MHFRFRVLDRRAMNTAAIKGGVAGVSIVAIVVLAALHQVTGAEAVDFAKWTIGVFLGGMSLLGAAQAIASRPGVPPIVGETLTTLATVADEKLEAPAVKTPALAAVDFDDTKPAKPEPSKR